MLQSVTFDEKGVGLDNTKSRYKSISIDYSEFIEEKLTDDTFGERLKKSRLQLGLSILDVANLCNITDSVVSGYECNRYTPTKKVLILLSSKFDIDYLCMKGYTKLVYNFDDFLDKLRLWIKENNLTREDAANKLGVSRSLIRFWFNGGVIKINTYHKIYDNLSRNNLIYFFNTQAIFINTLKYKKSDYIDMTFCILIYFIIFKYLLNYHLFIISTPIELI